jgi:endonuclease/exonuclease/phosphatase family metal-dependent hydrolase
MLAFQAQYLREQLVDYDYVGRSREMSNADGEQCGVFFRTSRFTPLEQGHFWLSETPEIPGSRGWDAALPRMATWLKLFDHMAERAIVLLNTHFDHRGAESRRHSANVMCAAVRRWSDRYPIIITGDFNCPEGSAPYQTLLGPQASLLRPLGDCYRLAHPERSTEEGTFHGFQGTRVGGRIDWVLVTPDLAVRSAQIITEAPDGRYPSDHFPVIAELTYTRSGEAQATPSDKP